MRVLLIDDHALFRIGLRELLERRTIEVADTGDERDAWLGAFDEMRPDVVLLDMRMPNTSGLAVLEELRTRDPRVPIAMLTTSDDHHDVIESLQLGARGYLLKDMEPDDLIAALDQIVAGQTVVAKELTSILARAVTGEIDKPNEVPAFSDLTPREREILCHLAAGQSNKTIARELGISDGTVKLHVKAILRKLDVHSRVEAAVIAVEKNLCTRNQQRD